MGKVFTEIDDRMRAFIAAQHMFFVATAPADATGPINCSPKGFDTFRVVGPTTVVYLEYNGSGIETIAHLRADGRIVIMFCAFDGPPRIVRLHGRGTFIEPHEPAFAELLPLFEPKGAVRSIVKIEVERISDSCGYGVPLMRYEGERPQLAAWAEKKGTEGVLAYQRQKNARSIDGLPGLPSAEPRDDE